MSTPSVISELEVKLSKLRETAQSGAFLSVWPQSARKQMIDEILDTQRRLDSARRAQAAAVAGRASVSIIRPREGLVKMA